MAALCDFSLATFIGLSLVCLARGQYSCKDLDTGGCQLFINSQKDFCTTSALAQSTCPRSCDLCPLTCYHCPTQPVNATIHCNTTKRCASDELCMISTLDASDGHTEHILSCIGKERCNGNGFGFHPVVGRRDINLHCCNTDLCNTPTFVAKTTLVPATTATIPPIFSCHKDIAFVVDESGSVGSSGFKQIIQFINDIITRLDIGSHADQMSLLLFDNGPHLQWYLKDYTSKADLLNALKYVPYHNGSTQTDKALQYVNEHVFQFQNGDRPSADNVVVVITDGMSNNHLATVTEAGKLRAEGAEIIAIGVGSAVNTELAQIAGSTSQALKVLGFDHLPDAISKVLSMIC